MSLNAHVKNHFEKMCCIDKIHKLNVSYDRSLNAQLKCLEIRETFSLTHHLKSPKQTNTGRKPYECFDCGKTFSQNVNLTSHKRTHTGEKPYECFDCGKTFSLNCTLTDHK